MSHPAVPPAASVVAGVVWGWSHPHLPSAVLVGVLIAAWLVAIGGTWRRTTCLVTGAVVVGGVAAGALLGSLATRGAVTTSLTTWHERVAPDRTGSLPVHLDGTLVRDAVITPYGVRLTLQATRVRVLERSWRVRGGVTVAVGGELASTWAATWTRGRRVRMPVTFRQPARFLNPGVADQRRAARLRGTSLLASVKSGLLVEVLDRGGAWAELAARVRRVVRDRVNLSVGAFSPRSAGIVTAILIGDRAGLGEDDRRRLQEAGTYHVVAISGGNIAVVSSLMLVVLRPVVWASSIRIWLTIIALVAYASLAGAEASVVRATVAASIFLAAQACDHRTRPLNTLAVTALVLLVLNPLSVVDAGFLLTFGATLGILVGVPRLVPPNRFERAGRWGGLVARAVVTVAVASGCAELALLPVSSTLFSRVTVAGLGLNLVAVPLMTVVQVAGLAVVALGDVAGGLARGVAWVAHLAATALVESASLVDRWPRVTWRVPPPGLVVSVVYYVAWMVVVTCRAVRVRGGAAAAVAVCAGLIVSGGPAGAGGSCGALTRPLRVVFLDVDQADATLVLTPSGRRLLVDAAGGRGGSATIGTRVVAPALWASGVRRLDYLVLTHGHPDHVGGAATVLSDFRPREVWEGVPVPSSEVLAALRRMARARNVAWRTVQVGDALSMGEVRVEVKHPPRPDWERPTVRNDDSVVLDIRYGHVSVVLPGDIGHEAERVVLDTIAPAAIRVLKVPHHGSRTSSSPEFVDRLGSQVVVVSAGRANPFGHPAPEVVRRYEDAGATVLSTATHGAITLCTDGREARLETAADTTAISLRRP